MGDQAKVAIAAKVNDGRPPDTPLGRACDFLQRFYAPWGSWKTVWWESVSGDVEYNEANALIIVQRILRGEA